MTEVDISCLCGKVRTAVRLQDEVPAPSLLCHQSQCRYNLGALCHSVLPIVDRPADSVLEQLRIFKPQPDLYRYFCHFCGSHVFENGECWKVQSGVVERIHSEQVSNSLERIVGHQSIEETIDGGLSVCMTGSENPPQEASMQSKPSMPPRSTPDSLQSAATRAVGHEDQDRLWASCLCGGVEFYLTRPDATSALCSSPWPDLIIPYFLQRSENPGDAKWWIRQESKWLAGVCACRSCRLGLGAPIQAWTFVSKSNLRKSDGNEFSYNLGTLQSFESSPGATREFCGTCGATAFWHNLERPGVVDVSVGLLRAAEGALATTWLHWWTERMSFSEEAVDQPLIAHVCSGLQRLGAIAASQNLTDVT